MALGIALEAVHSIAPKGRVLRLPPLHMLAPAAKTPRLQFPPHQGDHFCLRQAKLSLNGFKRRSVFPSHLDDPVCVPVCKCVHVAKTAFAAHCSLSVRAVGADKGRGIEVAIRFRVVSGANWQPKGIPDLQVEVGEINPMRIANGADLLPALHGITS